MKQNQILCVKLQFLEYCWQIFKQTLGLLGTMISRTFPLLVYTFHFKHMEAFLDYKIHEYGNYCEDNGLVTTIGLLTTCFTSVQVTYPKLSLFGPSILNL